MKYAWGPYGGLVGDAQAVGEHLEALREKNGGRLTPDLILKDAGKMRSPIHMYFEWVDTVAAHEHRLNQARYLVRRIIVRIEENSDTPTVRAFVKVEDDGGGFYTSIQAALSNEDMHKQVLTRALKEAKDWQRRYKDLAEFAAVFAAINAVAV